jgi:hypothetical protein
MAPSVVCADFTFGEPVKFGPAITGNDAIDCISYDGLEIYFESTRPGGQGGYDLWVSKRESKDDAWNPPENLGPAVNSPNMDVLASISADGLTLYLCSDRPYGDNTTCNIFVATRTTKKEPWGQAVKAGPAINGAGGVNFGAWISPDNLELYVNTYRSGIYGRTDIYRATRATASDPWDDAMNLGPVVNTTYSEALSCLSPDGRLLLFSEHYSTAVSRPDGYGGADIWMARRTSLSAPWQTPVNLGSGVNSPSHDAQPRVSPDGRTLYFISQRKSGWDVWEAPIAPICDLNGDGNVDEKDILVMTEHWGQDYPGCDIGPFPWGDDIVDVRDQMILLEAIEGPGFILNPRPHTSEVPRNVVLNWTAPKFAKTHDVYFGTSFEDVHAASRSDPRGVLVGQGQTATTYDPPGSLEFGRTYYWRVDEIGPAPDVTLYRGPVMNFTTEAFAYPITNVVATASSASAGSGSANTVNECGLDQNDGHSTVDTHMWLSAFDGPQPAWIQYEFDGVHALHEMWVWNYNCLLEPIVGFGFKDVSIEYSTNGTDWTVLSDTEFAQATGQDRYTHNTTVKFDGIGARYVRLTAASNWGGASAPCGLSEVRFFSVPLYSSQPAPPSGRTGVNVDAMLTWRPGREAVSHRVYFDTDRESVVNGVALVDVIADHAFDPGPLELGETYYWRIDEVNETATPSIRPGEVWSFSTREYHVVDDFENYNDDQSKGTCIYQTWIDGFSNKTGAQVGYTQSPFAERTVIHGGKQSMPLYYNNGESPFHSRAERTFPVVQNWTANGADTFKLWFRGNPIDFVERENGSIRMSGGGGDIWGTSDQFRFAYKQLNGDGSIVAKVHSLTPTSGWAKAGVMIRGGLASTATYAFMFPTPDGVRAFQDRTTIGSNAVSAHSDPGAISLPLWVKVERKGGNFTGYYSQDGQTWIVNQPENASSDSVNPVRIAMTKEAYIGLALTSHNVSMPAIAEFSDVSFTGAVTGDWQVEAIGVEQPSNDAAPMYITIEDDTGHAKSVVHPDPAAVQTIEWRQWLIPFRDFTSADVSLSSVKKMSIGVGDPGNPTAGGAGVIYIDDIGVGHPLSE